MASIVAGFYWRIGMYWWNRALWLDPAMLAVNVSERSYAELWGPLDLNQAAPVGFLWLAKATAAPFDYGELALCFWPLVSSLAALVLLAQATWRIAGPEASFVATAGLAASTTAIYYAGEFKPYAFDLLAATVCLFLGLRSCDAGSRRSPRIWGCLGVFLPFFSHAGVLIYAGISVAFLIAAWRQGTMRRLLPWLALAGVAQGSIYLFQIRPSMSEQLFEVHAGSYLSWPPTFEFWTKWWTDYAQFPLGFVGGGAPALAALATGLLVVGRRSRIGHALIFPWLLIFLAAALRHFPLAVGSHEIHSRFLLVTLPLALVGVGIGASALGRGVGSRLAWIPILLLILWPSVERAWTWPRFLEQDMRSLVAKLDGQFLAGDQIYVFHASEPAFRYYTRQVPRTYLAGSALDDPAVDLPRDLHRLSRGRAFLVLSHTFANEESLIRADLDERGERLGLWRFPGATLLLYDIHRAR